LLHRTGAQLIGDVRLADASSVWFNAVLRADDEFIEIGAGSNVQDGTIIHCDEGTPTIVGRSVTSAIACCSMAARSAMRAWSGTARLCSMGCGSARTV